MFIIQCPILWYALYRVPVLVFFCFFLPPTCLKRHIQVVHHVWFVIDAPRLINRKYIWHSAARSRFCCFSSRADGLIVSERSSMQEAKAEGNVNHPFSLLVTLWYRSDRRLLTMILWRSALVELKLGLQKNVIRRWDELKNSSGISVHTCVRCKPSYKCHVISC